MEFRFDSNDLGFLCADVRNVGYRQLVPEQTADTVWDVCFKLTAIGTTRARPSPHSRLRGQPFGVQPNENSPLADKSFFRDL